MNASHDLNQEWIDGHLDLAYLAVNGRDLCRACSDAQAGCVSLPDLAAAPIAIAIATIFTEPGGTDAAGYPSSDDLDAAAETGRRQLRVYEQLERDGALSIVRTIEDLERAGSKPPLSIVLLMEGADPIRDPADVAAWYGAGLRMVGMAWASGTRYAGGNSRGGPLTASGVDLVRALDDAGIIHDASHLSDVAFDGLFEHARGPIVATHSNCRSLLPGNERHLRDEQIRAVAARDGIIGLNLFGQFLAVDRRATISDAVAHVEHVVEVMGHRRGVALGSDMDGGFGPEFLPEGLDHPRKLPALADALVDRGWSIDDVEGFRRGNWLRFLRGSLG